jgi:hypothetical protein
VDRSHDLGTGRTTRQMRAAKRDSVFIVGNRNMVDYARHLAESIGRDDLKIVTLTWLEENSWRGREFTGITVDHDLQLTEKQQTLFDMAMRQVR